MPDKKEETPYMDSIREILESIAFGMVDHDHSLDWASMSLIYLNREKYPTVKEKQKVAEIIEWLDAKKHEEK